VKVKFYHTRYRALGPELIPVYRQSAHWWLYLSHPPGGRLPLLSTRPAVTFPVEERHLPRRLPREDLARKSARPAAARAAVGLLRRARPVQLAELSADFCPTRAFPRMSVGDASVYTCTCTVHDKLSCTRLQNYMVGAFLKSVLVSVPWNLSFTEQPQLNEHKCGL